MPTNKRLTPSEIEALPTRAREARQRALEALNRMRKEGLSASATADRAGTTLDTVKKYAGHALRQTEDGRWEANPWDRIIRLMKFPTPAGTKALDVRDSRSAEKIARYWAAVRDFLQTGSREALEPFHGETVQVRGTEHAFVTNASVLKRLGRAGEVRFEHIYVSTDGAR